MLAAVGARFALAGAEPGYPYLTFSAAVLLTAVLFGRWPGILATAASAALALWFFIPPTGSMRVVDARAVMAVLAFVATGLCFVWLSSAAHHAIRERDNANRALRDGQERLRTVLEGIGEPFYAVDRD